jgi:hypothetical protein
MIDYSLTDMKKNFDDVDMKSNISSFKDVGLSHDAFMLMDFLMMDNQSADMEIIRDQNPNPPLTDMEGLIDQNINSSDDFQLDQIMSGLSHSNITRFLAGENEGVPSINVNTDPAPAFEHWYTTPFQTQITKITGQANSNHAYSQLQAFSTDHQYILLTEDIAGSPSALHIVRDINQFQQVMVEPIGVLGNPRWDPAYPHHLIYFEINNDNRLSIMRRDVLTGAVQAVFIFPPEYQSYLNNQSFDELSRDGRWIAGQGIGANNWSRIFTVDLVNQTLGAQVDPMALYNGPCIADPQWGEVDPDWIGVSPLGNYLVVQWGAEGTGRCEGLESYDISNGTYIGHVTAGHPHADLTVLADGITEVFVSAELSGPIAPQTWVNGTPTVAIDSANPALAYRILPGAPNSESPPQFLYLIDWGGFEHISCRGPYGTCVLTGYPSPDNGSLDPLEDEIYLIYLSGEKLIRLAHHHSSGSDYWSQPRASISLNGRYIIFDSDWSLNNETIAYLIDLQRVVD